MQETPQQVTRPRVEALDAILGVPFPVLDVGFVRVVDYMGSDGAIVQAARVSYGAGTKRVQEDRALIRYLLRHEHTTPFEMCEIKLHIRTPMDVWRQWIRHRTANVNEYSTRYSVAIDAALETDPRHWRIKSTTSAQGSEGFLPESSGTRLSAAERELHLSARRVYEDRLAAGVAREQARKDLPLSTYTEAYWKDARKKKLGDIKDANFPDVVADLARLKPLACVARAITAATEKRCNALVLTGDLTSMGDSGGYRDCLNFLNDLFNLKRWPVDSVHVVPGNHDVDRPQVDPAGVDLTAKFAVFADAWNHLGLPILAVDSVRESSVGIAKRFSKALTLFSLNSSLGCGERRFPKQVRDGLAKLLDEYAIAASPKEAFELLGETLDTPAFDRTHVEKVCETIRKMDRNSVPVVIAHHNILPQASLRIAVYTELINAGFVRYRPGKFPGQVLTGTNRTNDEDLDWQIGGSRCVGFWT